MIHPSARLQALLPVDKNDLARAEAAVTAGYPAVEPILGPLVEWLRDCNWPVARVLAPFLQSIGAPLVPHIRDVMHSDDDVWKYWVIGTLIPSLPMDSAAEFRPELERLACAPTPSERTGELDEKAREVLGHFGWTGGDA